MFTEDEIDKRISFVLRWRARLRAGRRRRRRVDVRECSAPTAPTERGPPVDVWRAILIARSVAAAALC